MMGSIKQRTANRRRARFDVDTSSRGPGPVHVQIDKHDDEWCLRSVVNHRITVRLRIQHFGYNDAPDIVRCEIADVLKGPQFHELGQVFWHPYDPAAADEWPLSWRIEFLRLARVWAKLNTLADCGLALGPTRSWTDEDGVAGTGTDNIRVVASERLPAGVARA